MLLAFSMFCFLLLLHITLLLIARLLLNCVQEQKNRDEADRPNLHFVIHLNKFDEYTVKMLSFFLNLTLKVQDWSKML